MTSNTLLLIGCLCALQATPALAQSTVPVSQEIRDLAAELEAGELAEQVGKSLLQDIQRVLVVPREATGQAVAPVAVAMVENPECLAIALVC